MAKNRIPAKQLHRAGTLVDLEEFLSDREIGFNVDDELLYVKYDGHLVPIGGRSVPIPTTQGFLVSNSTGRFGWEPAIKGPAPYDDNIEVWGSVGGVGFAAEYAVRDSEGIPIASNYYDTLEDSESSRIYGPLFVGYIEGSSNKHLGIGSIDNLGVLVPTEPPDNDGFETGDVLIANYSEGVVSYEWVHPDSQPTENSNMPVTSGGVYSAITSLPTIVYFDVDLEASTGNPTAVDIQAALDGGKLPVVRIEVVGEDDESIYHYYTFNSSWEDSYTFTAYLRSVVSTLYLNPGDEWVLNDTPMASESYVNTAIAGNGKGVYVFEIDSGSAWPPPSDEFPTYAEIHDKVVSGFRVILCVTTEYHGVTTSIYFELSKDISGSGTEYYSFVNCSNGSSDIITVDGGNTWSREFRQYADSLHYHGNNSTTGIAHGGTAPSGVTGAAQKTIFGDGSWSLPKAASYWSGGNNSVKGVYIGTTRSTGDGIVGMLHGAIACTGYSFGSNPYTTAAEGPFTGLFYLWSINNSGTISASGRVWAHNSRVKLTSIKLLQQNQSDGSVKWYLACANDASMSFGVSCFYLFRQNADIPDVLTGETSTISYDNTWDVQTSPFLPGNAQRIGSPTIPVFVAENGQVTACNFQVV